MVERRIGYPILRWRFESSLLHLSFIWEVTCRELFERFRSKNPLGINIPKSIGEWDVPFPPRLRQQLKKWSRRGTDPVTGISPGLRALWGQEMTSRFASTTATSESGSVPSFIRLLRKERYGKPNLLSFLSSSPRGKGAVEIPLNVSQKTPFTWGETDSY